MRSNPDAPRRIIYVPGVRPKPPPAIHQELLWRCLLVGVRRADPEVADRLAASPENLRLALWGHLFYPTYRNPRLDEAGIAGLIVTSQPNLQSIREVFQAGYRLNYLGHRWGDWVPRLTSRLAPRATRINMEDCQRYFRNEDGVGDRIRAILRVELERSWGAGERVALVAHSFGSVIAWDTLFSLGLASGPIDLFLTLGSPLGTRYIRHSLLSANLKGADAFPRGIRQWRNLSAVGGVIALGHCFGDDFAQMQSFGLV